MRCALPCFVATVHLTVFMLRFCLTSGIQGLIAVLLNAGKLSHRREMNL
jgi:hypothetical protein